MLNMPRDIYGSLSAKIQGELCFSFNKLKRFNSSWFLFVKEITLLFYILEDMNSIYKLPFIPYTLNFFKQSNMHIKILIHILE